MMPPVAASPGVRAALTGDDVTGDDVSYWRRDRLHAPENESRRRRSPGPAGGATGARHRLARSRPADNGWRHDHRRFLRCSMRQAGAAARSGAAAAASFFCVIACSTSPGREIFDRSIFVLISSSPRIRARTRLASRRRTFRRGADVHPHLLRFVLFQRTGVRLLLGHPYQRKRIQNGFALYFQLSG